MFTTACTLPARMVHRCRRGRCITPLLVLIKVTCMQSPVTFSDDLPNSEYDVGYKVGRDKGEITGLECVKRV